MAAGVEFFDNKFFGLSNMEAGGGTSNWFSAGKIDLSNSVTCPLSVDL